MGFLAKNLVCKSPGIWSWPNIKLKFTFVVIQDALRKSGYSYFFESISILLGDKEISFFWRPRESFEEVDKRSFTGIRGRKGFISVLENRSFWRP